MKRTWSVLAVYEDSAGREQAMQFCDGLVGRFWSQCEYNIQWRSLNEVGTAVKEAADADFIVVAMKTADEVPFELAEWTEGWVRERGEREGVIIGLTDGTGEVPVESGRHCYLRDVAHRAGMDFLTQLPQTLAQVPESLEDYSQRAGQVTSVLDEIIHRQWFPLVSR